MPENSPPAERRLSIKQWDAQDRPREKLLEKGRESLTNSELLGILLGTGIVGMTAVALAQLIMSKVDNNLDELGRMSIEDLQQFKGIGEAKAITIAAALELGRRRRAAEARQLPTVTSAATAFEILLPHLQDLEVEQFYVLLLNRANRVIEVRQISSGGTSATVVDLKLVFRHAITRLANGIILAHNHPSGKLTPSQADIDLTSRAVEVGLALDLKVLDHIIVGRNQFFSFADSGKL